MTVFTISKSRYEIEIVGEVRNFFLEEMTLEIWSQILISPIWSLIFMALHNCGFQAVSVCFMAIQRNYRKKWCITSLLKFLACSFFWSVQGIVSHYLFEVGSRKDDYFCFRDRELCNRNQKLSKAMWRISGRDERLKGRGQ